MTPKRLLIHSVFLFLLPLIVAWYGLSVPITVLLVLLALLWRWLISLSGIVAPENIPEFELETISASHFAEKVRWCMDRLGLDYHERQVAGTIGVFFTGRTVPLLKIRTGIVRSRIGNSPDILRYLWGRFAAPLGEKADFLKPTPARLEWEEKLDSYGRSLQVWVYYHILDDPKLTQHAWGCNSPSIPAWQRYLVVAIFPVLRFLIRKSFRINDTGYQIAVEKIEKLLAEIDAMLADGRCSILGDETINYTDITFASLSALWARPKQFGKGKSDDVRVDPEDAPTAMRSDMDRWTGNYANASALIARLYETERGV